MHKKILSILGLSLAVLALPAAAEEAAGSAAAEAGSETRQLLETQRSGSAASDTPRPMSGEVAKRAHQRYVDSFSHPIPESFSEEEQEFVKGDN